VKEAGVTELRQPVPEAPSATLGARVRAAAADFWLRSLFFFSERLPWVPRATRGLFVWGAYQCSPAIREATAANARRILGEGADDATVRRVGRGVVGSFYDFVCDVGRSRGMSREELAGRIERVEGRERYLAMRQAGRGAIIVTAHMGSFEVGVAALLELEKRIHVVFKRDTGRFERIRQGLRQRLGVVEQAVDEGWGVWVNLRDALKANEVVAIQGDRVMPGQKGSRVPFLGGHVLLPTGPVKLAIASGAPIVPVFSLRTAEGKIKLFVEEPIEVGHDVDEAMATLAAVIGRYVAKYPEQWLVLHPAFEEDAAGRGGAHGR
jgi:phosphatidylinositol dimannoside acyltransferase